MPHHEDVHVDVRDVTLHQPDDSCLGLGCLPGVWLIVLLRHRH